MRTYRVLAWVALGLIGTLLLFFCAGYLFAGRMAAKSFVAALGNRNMSEVVHWVDAPRLRAAAAEDWSAMVPSSFKLPGLGSLGDELRIAVNLGLRSVEVDEPTLADMLGHLMTGHGLVTARVSTMVPVSLAPTRTPTYSFSGGQSSDSYLLTVQFAETGEQIIATFERRGMFTWRLVRVQPNSPSALWPFRMQR